MSIKKYFDEDGRKQTLATLWRWFLCLLAMAVAVALLFAIKTCMS